MTEREETARKIAADVNRIADSLYRLSDRVEHWTQGPLPFGDADKDEVLVQAIRNRRTEIRGAAVTTLMNMADSFRTAGDSRAAVCLESAVTELVALPLDPEPQEESNAE